MTSPISHKLKALGVKVDSQKPSQPAQLVSSASVEHVLAGKVIENTAGETYLVETIYPLNLQHGLCDLCLNTSFEIVSAWAKESNIHNAAPEAFAFLDIETTGLSSGTGTYAFLVGIGRYIDGQFHLAQFFLQDPSEEQAYLSALESFLVPNEILVSFNGKSFDVPLLNTRYEVQGRHSPLSDLIQVDLLHLARRLWRYRLSSRTLGTLETQILAYQRTEEDVPGWQVPQIYFDYLRTGDAHPLRGVFYHNAVDILSLVALFKYITTLLDDPWHGIVQDALDWPALGKLFVDLGREETAIACYHKAMQSKLPPHLYTQTVHELSLLHKRRREWTLALELWQLAAKAGEIYAFVELAKWHEHQKNDPATALHWTQSAIDHLLLPDTPRLERFQWQDELAHRIKRLLRKTGKGSQIDLHKNTELFGKCSKN